MILRYVKTVVGFASSMSAAALVTLAAEYGISISLPAATLLVGLAGVVAVALGPANEPPFTLESQPEAEGIPEAVEGDEPTGKHCRV